MGLFRRHGQPPGGGALGAAAEAVASRERAEAELGRQRDARAAEHRDVVAPLRRMRDRNHLAEMFIRTIEDGWGRR